MRTSQCDATRPDHAPTAGTSRRRHKLRIAGGTVVAAIALVACGSNDNTHRGTDAQATPVAQTELPNHTTSPPETVRLPDLTDPATHKQFVCSFADGYFTALQPPNNSTSYCR
jgi:hypothetical protein